MNARRALSCLAVFVSLIRPLPAGGQPAAGPGAGNAVVPKDSIEGFWMGTVTSPQGPAEVGFQVRRTPKGQLVAFCYMPVMHIYGLPVSRVKAAGNEYVFEDISTNATLEGDTLRGTYAWAKMPFTLTRAEKFPEKKVERPAFPAGPEPVWTRSLGAPIWGSPAVQGGVLYAGAADGKLHALRVRDGASVWTWTGPSPLYGEPLVTADAVYSVGERGELFKLAKKDGRLVWRVPLQAEAPAGGKPVEDDTYSHRTPVPVIEGGVVYVGSGDGVFHALEAANGTERWRFSAGAKICAGAAIEGDRVFFGAMDGTVFALD